MKRKTIFPEDLNKAPFVESPDLPFTEEQNLEVKQPSSTKVLMYYSGGGNAKMVGNVTNNTYIFKEGHPTEVDEADVAGLLEFKRVGTCCGGTADYETKLFEKA